MKRNWPIRALTWLGLTLALGVFWLIEQTDPALRDYVHHNPNEDDADPPRS